ncbi:substrate-binding periplasmic protein [Thalassotalea fusca]
MKPIRLRSRREFSTLLLLIFSLLFCAASTADHRTVKVVTEYLEPYQIKADDGSLDGYCVEVVRALFDITHDHADIRALPWARAYEIAKSEPNIMIFSMARTPTREQLFQWVGSLKNERLYFWGLKDRFEGPVESYQALQRYRVAASRYSNVAEFLEHEEFSNIHHLIKEDQNMLMLYRGRVDLVVATQLTLETRAKKLGLNFAKLIKLKEVPELNNDLSIAFNLQSSPELVQRYQSAYRKLVASGKLEEIKQKWQMAPATQ